MRIVVLGASGNAGREVAALLAPRLAAGDELVLAGRSHIALEATRAATSGPARVSTARVDVSRQPDVRAVVAGAGLVIVTVSRPDLVAPLARIVLDAGADWIDTMLSSPRKLAALRALEPEIERAGRCFVTDGGFHPGLPAALVRWAAGRLDVLREADVVGGLRLDWRAETLADSTVEEMLDEFGDFDMTAFVDGRRRQVRWSECPTVDFGPPIGRKTCAPMPLAEMDALPETYPSLRRCGFYIAGFTPVFDYGVLPVLTVLAKLRALRPLTIRLTRWSFRRLASPSPPHRLVIRLEASGERDGTPATARVSVSGDDGYLLTAAPVASCALGILDGTVRAPGLHLQAHLLPADTFLDDLAAFGLEVQTRLDAVR